MGTEAYHLQGFSPPCIINIPFSFSKEIVFWKLFFSLSISKYICIYYIHIQNLLTLLLMLIFQSNQDIHTVHKSNINETALFFPYDKSNIICLRKTEKAGAVFFVFVLFWQYQLPDQVSKKTQPLAVRFWSPNHWTAR